MPHADQGKQTRTTTAIARSEERQLEVKTQFEETRVLPSIQPSTTTPPNIEVIERPTQLGSGTFFRNEFNLSDNQLKEFQRLLDLKIPKSDALTQARGLPVRTPAEGIKETIGDIFAVGSLFPLSPRIKEILEASELSLKGLRDFLPTKEEQHRINDIVLADLRADRLGLRKGSARDNFIKAEIKRLEGQRTKIALEERFANPGPAPENIGSSPIQLGNPRKVLPQGEDPSPGELRFGAPGAFAGSPDTLARQIDNWNYNIGLLALRIQNDSEPNYLNRLMLIDYMSAIGESDPEASADAFLEDKGYGSIGGELYHSNTGTPYVQGRGISLGGGTQGSGGGSIFGVGSGGIGGGTGGGGSFRFPALGGASAGLYNWRITA